MEGERRRRRMHLVGFLLAGPTSHHHGMWRHPETDNGFLDPAYWEHIILALSDFYKGSYETVLSRGGQMGLLDPIPMLSMMARVTRHIGLATTMSTTAHKAYHLARVLGTLDVLSGGRVAWNIVTTSSHTQARNFGIELLERDTRYDHGDEVVEACCRLWESWEPDALVLDRAAGVFADASRVHRVDYAGRWVFSRGPLTVPRSPQGRPVLMQAGSSPRGRDFGARWAEVIFTLQHEKADMQAFRADLRARVARAGRDPDDCRILVSVDPIIGETRSIATAKQDYVNSLVDPELGLALVSAHIGTDLSGYALDQPIADLEIREGSRGSFDVILQGTKSGGLTLGEAARRFAISELCPQLVGTPVDIADEMQDLFESGACDGFMLTPTVFPGTFEQFTRSVVPELQKRALFRTQYSGRTLRENLV
jgi:FMN-dependent oxidoreductase (nitrilotriacetate monooxygenase family)